MRLGRRIRQINPVRQVPAYIFLTIITLHSKFILNSEQTVAPVLAGILAYAAQPKSSQARKQALAVLALASQDKVRQININVRNE